MAELTPFRSRTNIWSPPVDKIQQAHYITNSGIIWLTIVSVLLLHYQPYCIALLHGHTQQINLKALQRLFWT